MKIYQSQPEKERRASRTGGSSLAYASGRYILRCRSPKNVFWNSKRQRFGCHCLACPAVEPWYPLHTAGQASSGTSTF